MKLTKQKIDEIKELGKSAKIVQQLYHKLQNYLIDELDLDVNFVIDNLNSIVNDDLTSEELIKIIQDELEE